jgi:AcrR family transcriptional regulator
VFLVAKERVMTERRRHLLPQKFVQDHQRRRLVSAIAKLAHEHGTVNVTTSRIVAASRMSRGTLYELFDSKDSCLSFALAQAYERIFEPVKAVSAAEPWIDRVDAALSALFAAIEAEPLLAELCLVHSLGAPDDTSVHQAAVETLIEAITPGPGADDLPLASRYTEELLARGILWLAGERVRQGRTAELPNERGALVKLVADSIPRAKGTRRVHGCEAA